jgi:hypothetical protein
MSQPGDRHFKSRTKHTRTKTIIGSGKNVIPRDSSQSVSWSGCLPSSNPRTDGVAVVSLGGCLPPSNQGNSSLDVCLPFDVLRVRDPRSISGCLPPANDKNVDIAGVSIDCLPSVCRTSADTITKQPRENHFQPAGSNTCFLFAISRCIGSIELVRKFFRSKCKSRNITEKDFQMYYCWLIEHQEDIKPEEYFTGPENHLQLRIGLAFEDFLPFLGHLKTIGILRRYKFHGKPNIGLPQMVRRNVDNEGKMFIILGYNLYPEDPLLANTKCLISLLLNAESRPFGQMMHDLSTVLRNHLRGYCCTLKESKKYFKADDYHAFCIIFDRNGFPWLYDNDGPVQLGRASSVTELVDEIYCILKICVYVDHIFSFDFEFA